MISEKLAEQIRKQKVKKVFVCVRGKITCTEFDKTLHVLAEDLRGVCQDIYFNCNGSSESYQIRLPDIVEEPVVRILTDTPLSIEPGWGFGALA